MIQYASACVGPCHPGAETAPLRENPFSRYPWACPARPPCPRMVHPAEGRAPHARKEGSGLIEACPPWATGFSPAHARGNEIPRHAFGHAKRTHGVRPSEKTAFRVISGFAPVRPPHFRWPLLEGRAPHARKEGPGLTETCPR